MECNIKCRSQPKLKNIEHPHEKNSKENLYTSNLVFCFGILHTLRAQQIDTQIKNDNDLTCIIQRNGFLQEVIAVNDARFSCILL